MGCWNETCGFSQHSILAHERVYGVVILGNPSSYKSCYSNGVGAPMSMMIEGEYNDYGSIENINPSFSATMLILTMNELYKMHKLVIDEHGMKDIDSNVRNDYGVTGFTVEEGFTDCETIFYFIERGYMHLSEHDYNGELRIHPIFFTMFKKEILDIAMNVVDTNTDYSYKDTSFEKVRDDVEMLYIDVFSNNNASMAEIEAILEDENISEEDKQIAQKLYFKMMRSSFSTWGGDELKSKHHKWGNAVRILAGYESVSRNSFNFIYKHLSENHKIYDKDDVVNNISNFIMLLHTFDLFRKIWAPQGHSSQNDNFNTELIYTEKLLRFMYNERRRRIDDGYDDEEDYTDVLGVVSIFENEEVK